MLELDPYAVFVALGGAALLLTTLGLRLLNRFFFPKFFVYLPVGVALGPYVLGVVSTDPLSGLPLLERLTEFAVTVSLVVAGMKIGRPLGWKRWSSTARLLLLVMPLTILLIAVTGSLLFGFAAGAAVLLGAVLAPTDPVLAGAVQLEEPADDDELTFGLTSEAGLNDGFAFPFVYLGLYLLARPGEWAEWGGYWVFKDVAYAIALALLAGWFWGHRVGKWFIERAQQDAISQQRRALIPLALMLVAYGVVQLLGAYGFLAAFSSGLGFRRALMEEHEALQRFASFSESVEGIIEALAIVALGAFLPLADMLALGWPAVVFAACTVLVIRPLVVLASTVRGGFTRTQRLYWAWFGIRGVGSLYYLSFAVLFGVPEALGRELFALTALTVIASNLLHGVTVYPMMRRVKKRQLIHP